MNLSVISICSQLLSVNNLTFLPINHLFLFLIFLTRCDIMDSLNGGAVIKRFSIHHFICFEITIHFEKTIVNFKPF